MRITFLIFLGILHGGLSVAQDPAPSVVGNVPVGDAWLGLGVSKPDETTTTQLPALPPGIGFVITTLDDEGPAKKAGIEKHDLLWKMNEQMLVNEGQLATLLRLAAPGDVVTVSIFRKGEPAVLKVTLGEAKSEHGELIRKMLNDSVMRRDDGAIRIVNVKKKTAVISNERGRAEVSRVDNGDAVRIFDPKGQVIYEGIISGRPELSNVPYKWRRQICAMKRSLDHSLSAKAAPMRQPRPRIVPPPAQVQKKSE